MVIPIKTTPAVSLRHPGLKRTRTMFFSGISQERRCVYPDSILGEAWASPCLSV